MKLFKGEGYHGPTLDSKFHLFIYILRFHLFIYLTLLPTPHSKMFKHRGQQKPVPEIMRLSGVCCASNMLDHDGRKVYLLVSIHGISETLIHGIYLIAPLPPWDDVLYDEPEQELIEWCRFTLLHCLGCLSPGC